MCLESVKELDYQNYNVIVVDNASEVRHVNSIRFFVENQTGAAGKFRLITSRSNLGYSGGNNLGIKSALKHDAHYVLILNPDTIVQKNLLSEMVASAESNGSVGLVSSPISEAGGVVYGGEVQWLKPELRHISSPPPDQRLPGGYYIVGACMLIKREVIKRIGLLDERYFLYFEDADYCSRATKAGYKLKIVRNLVVDHNASASTRSLAPALLLRYHFRNAHLFNFKNSPLWAKFALPFWSVFIIIKQLVKLLIMPQKREISRAILAGVQDFYRGHFGRINE